MSTPNWVKKQEERIAHDAAKKSEGNPFGRQSSQKPPPKTNKKLRTEEQKRKDHDSPRYASVPIKMAELVGDVWVNKMNTDKDGKIYSFVENKDKWTKETAFMYLTALLNHPSNNLMEEEEKIEYLTALEQCFEQPGVNQDEIIKAIKTGDMDLDTLKNILSNENADNCITELTQTVGDRIHSLVHKKIDIMHQNKFKQRQELRRRQREERQDAARREAEKEAQQRREEIFVGNLKKRVAARKGIILEPGRGGKKKSKKAKKTKRRKTNKKTNTKKRHNKKSRIHKRHKLHKRYKTRRQR